MQKIIVVLAVIALALSFAACGDSAPADAVATQVPAETATETVKPTDPPAVTETEKQTESPQETEQAVLVSVDGNNITVRDDGSGEKSTGNGMERTPVLTNRNIGYSGEAGPIIYSVDAIQISSITATEESAASMLGLEQRKAGTLVAIKMTVENTSDDDISFYPYMSTIITNTKEQVESNWLLSDSVGGDFYGQVKKDGQIYWICSGTDAKDLTHIQWRIDSPHDSNYEHFGDEIKIEIEFSK